MAGYAQHEDLGSILMRVILTLSEKTDSGEQREEEKRELERQFQQSDQKLDSLVLQHQKDLTKVMQLYAKVNNRLTTSRTRVKAIKERLVSCKELLHYKRDELKKEKMKKKTQISQSAIFIIFIALIWLVFNEAGIMKWYTLKNEQHILMQSINELYNDETLIEDHINKLTHDFDYIEFIAYSRYKMVKQGEKIFRVKDYKEINQ